jgi:enoyl-CoA hydratase/carnithine racemase
VSVVEVERSGRVAVVEINRPEVHNCVNDDVTRMFDDVFDVLERDDDVWACVLTGAGDRAFCAGQDLRALDRGGPTYRSRYGWAGMARRSFPKPLIAAVNGYALGGGFELALLCDLVVAEEHATFGLPEVSRGIVAAAGGIVRLAQRIPLAKALELGMLGETITAEDMRTLGLVNKVVPKGCGRSEAVRLADRLCANAPLAVRLTKRIMRASVSVDENELWEVQAQGMRELRESWDAAEGPRAFVEKRQPVWRAC